MTCHIVVMRHTESNVASLGHFDNFSCWQFGEESSAHKEGLKVMMDEIEYLSKGDLDNGHIQVFYNRWNNSPHDAYYEPRPTQLSCLK